MYLTINNEASLEYLRVVGLVYLQQREHHLGGWFPGVLPHAEAFEVEDYRHLK